MFWITLYHRLKLLDLCFFFKDLWGPLQYGYPWLFFGSPDQIAERKTGGPRSAEELASRGNNRCQSDTVVMSFFFAIMNHCRESVIVVMNVNIFLITNSIMLINYH